MEGKQCKQMERYTVMAKGSDCFLSLDDKSKQRYKVKIDICKGMTLIKKGKTFRQYKYVSTGAVI